MEIEIRLKNLRFFAYIGVYDEEKTKGNEFLVNLSVYIPVSEEIEKDHLEYTVSYEDLYNIIDKEIHVVRNLLETVSVEIAKKIKQKYPFIIRGKIEVEKVNPPIPGMIGRASVTLNF